MPKYTKPPADIWEDPDIKELLQECPADDIMVLDCPRCGRMSYYNQGSHFTCRFHCGSWYVCNEDEAPPPDRRYMYSGDMRSLADTLSDFGPEIP